jgi:NitT/TauT family transport system substrate-binding protein
MQPSSQVLRIGVDDRPTYIPLAAVSEFLDNASRRLNIERIEVPDAELRWQMLAAGRLDVACGSLDSFVQAAARSNPGAIIFKIGTSAGSDVLLTAPDIQSVRALAGKKVAVVAGRPGAYLLGYFLDRVSMSPSEVQTVETDDVQDAARLLETGKVQGAWLWYPHAAPLAARGFRILADSREHDIIDEVCVANHTVLDSKRNELLAFMQAWFTLVDLLEANPGLAKEPIARRAHIPSTTLGTLLKGVQWTDLVENQRLDPSALVARMQEIQRFWRLIGTANVSRPIEELPAVRLDLVRDVRVESNTSVFGRPSSPSSATP